MTAAIVAVEAEEPRILVAADPKGGTRAGLPFGPFDPLSHRTFEIGLRNWVAAQTAINVGYVEQLYTFGDRGRHAPALRQAPAGFEPWYRFFPWTGATAGRGFSIRQSCPCWSSGAKPVNASRRVRPAAGNGCGI